MSQNGATALADPTVLFVHIMKTGGQTVKGIAFRHYQREQITFVDSGSYIDEFAQLSEQERHVPRLILGHMPYGIHAHISRPTRYITMLRDPIERTISHYHFMLRDPTSYMHERVVQNGWSLADYLRQSSDRMIDNAQVRALSGAWNRVPVGELSEEMLELACERLRSEFAVVGLTERFDDSLLLMQRALNWSYVYYQRKLNATANRPKVTQLDAETIELIEGRNQLDRRLYEVATNVFEQQMAQYGVKGKLGTPRNQIAYFYWLARHGMQRLFAAA